jgi:hypothetical protein
VIENDKAHNRCILPAAFVTPANINQIIMMKIEVG